VLAIANNIQLKPERPICPSLLPLMPRFWYRRKFPYSSKEIVLFHQRTVRKKTLETHTKL